MIALDASGPAMRVTAQPVVFVGGWAAHRHVGDDAILRVHLEALDAAGLDVEPVVLGTDPDVLAARFGVRAHAGLDAYVLDGADATGAPAGAVQRLGAVAAAAAGRAPAPADADVLGVLELLGDAAALIDLGAGSLATQFREALWVQAATVAAASALGVPAAIAGVTLGPFDRPLDAMVMRRMLREASFVSVRDRGASVAEACALGRPDALPGWDPAMQLEAASDTALPADGGFAVVSVDAASAPGCAATIEALHARAIPTIAVPMDFFPLSSDVDALLDLRARLADPDALRVPPPTASDAELVGLVGAARVAFGSRYHLGVFAASQGTPAVLVHRNDYGERKAAGLADWTDGVVSTVPAAAGAEALRDAVLGQLGRARGPRWAAAQDPLPAIDWLAVQLQGRAARATVPEPR